MLVTYSPFPCLRPAGPAKLSHYIATCAFSFRPETQRISSQSHCPLPLFSYVISKRDWSVSWSLLDLPSSTFGSEYMSWWSYFLVILTSVSTYNFNSKYVRPVPIFFLWSCHNRIPRSWTISFFHVKWRVFVGVPYVFVHLYLLPLSSQPQFTRSYHRQFSYQTCHDRTFPRHVRVCDMSCPKCLTISLSNAVSTIRETREHGKLRESEHPSASCSSSLCAFVPFWSSLGHTATNSAIIV